MHRQIQIHKPSGFVAVLLREVFVVLDAEGPSGSDVQALTATVAGAVFLP